MESRSFYEAGNSESGQNRQDFEDHLPNGTEDCSKPDPSKPTHSRSNFSSHFLWFLLTIALFFAAWYLGPNLVERYQYAAAKGRVQAQYEHAVETLEKQPLNNVSMAYQLVAQKIKPSVVSVNTQKIGSNVERNTIENVASEGSGVVLTEDGYILTNNHVVQNARRIDVILYDRRVYEATVIGSDEWTDLAVLKIEANNLIPAEWGDSDECEVGTLVWAVGNPYGLRQTITSGILSGKDRQGESSIYQEFLQTDAAVNPGNSGGPLVDASGKVIGINTSIYGPSFQGISFAVPSILAQHVYRQIRKHGKVERGFLGVLPGVVFQHHADQLQLSDLDGAIILQVDNETPASDAGIEVGDVIRSWDGHPVTNWRHLYRYVSMTQPNSCATVQLIRGGELLELTVKVTDRPPDEKS